MILNAKKLQKTNKQTNLQRCMEVDIGVDDTVNNGHHSLIFLKSEARLQIPGDCVGIMDGEGVTLAW